MFLNWLISAVGMLCFCSKESNSGVNSVKNFPTRTKKKQWGENMFLQMLLQLGQRRNSIQGWERINISLNFSTTGTKKKQWLRVLSTKEDLSVGRDLTKS